MPQPSNKSIVFDSFTNIHDEGMAFWITDGAVAETVSCFTYYNHISYAATRGGRLRSLVGNSSWGNYGVVSSGFSPLEKAREGEIEGLVLQYDVDSILQWYNQMAHQHASHVVSFYWYLFSNYILHEYV